jgi:alkylation response protein AidB-like acyl-CoA dehydrogenase
VNFDYNEEQQLLAASIRRFVEKDYGFEARKKIVASPEGCSPAIWSTLAELGVLGLPLPSDFGGFGGGAVDLLSVMEAFGESLVVEPFLATVAVGAQLIARGGTPAQKARFLHAVAGGRLMLAFAHTERDARYDLSYVATRAEPAGEGYVLDGEKRLVLHAPCAQLLLVSARTRGEVGEPQGVSVFLVDATAPGVTLRRYRTIDELPAADVSLHGVTIGADALIGGENDALPLIEEVVDYATALVCAEAVGAIAYANDATLEYLKTRRQFGVPIGSFQALQHRMVDMVLSYEQAKSMASLACATVDGERDPARRKRVVSAAKVRIADACRHVSQESVQLHGGMGMSDEMKVSHTFRRLTMIAQQFGDADHHLERFARSQ